MYDINQKDCFQELIFTGGFTWQRNNTTAATDTIPTRTTTTMSRLNMILVTASKANMGKTLLLLIVVLLRELPFLPTIPLLGRGIPPKERH